MSIINKAIKSVGNIVGSAMNSLTGVSDTAKQSYSDSVNLMNLENANNVALWNMQNEYNTPAAQIARMKEAGIDVNPMTYAVGNGNMSTTASSVATSTPHMPSYSSAGNPVSTLMSVLTGLDQLENNKKHRALLQTQIDNWEKDHASPYKDFADAIKNIFTPGKKSGIVDAFGRYLNWFSNHLARPSRKNGKVVDKREDEYYNHNDAYEYLYRFM